LAMASPVVPASATERLVGAALLSPPDVDVLAAAAAREAVAEQRAAAHPAAGRFDDAPFIRACRRQSVDHVPVWFMRQAGRSLPEYRAARGQGSILDAIAQPELVADCARSTPRSTRPTSSRRSGSWPIGSPFP